MTSSPRHAVEFHLARWALAGIDALSYDAAIRLGRVLASLWWAVDLPRRRVAITNIVSSGITSDRREARSISRRCAESFGMLVIESLKSAELLGGGDWKDHVELALEPDVVDVLEDPQRPLIMVSGHLGNWELAAQLLSRYKPVAGITREMNNPRVEELVSARKARDAFRPIPKYGAAATRLIEVLEDRQILALLTDQHARKGGVMLEFFGRPAATYTTPAMLHLVTRAPLCFACCRRFGPRRFVLSSSPLIEVAPSGNRQRDVRAILEKINGYLEEEIRESPDQYLWGHRRWRD